ncbi:MAG: aminotransferase class I/II-fold pyridoxal phosphate-dependent enzyme [Alphaproteobacteria bacterium]|nr:aminotransferase class I/II-fold pyridoxal phosphate-dependent enzyme [Alphaproteobacteria bacterium]MBV8548139.1 aminotransferase class I/II-fold pyridoxal phosphate-dependent enzyme [Alphaproteobacteria bacterium]
MTSFRPMLDRYVVPDMPSTSDILPFLRQIESNRWYSNFGPLVREFEKQMTQFLQSTANPVADKPLHLVTLSTCYDALRVGLQTFHLPRDAQVLVPAVTFPACALAVQHAGLTPVLADVDVTQWQLTPHIARQIVARNPVRAVMPVAVYGVPVPWQEWDAFVADTGVPVIIDAAAALEVQKIPTRCLVAHSLHATKPFGIGEGGVLVARDPAVVHEARRLTNFGTEQRITLASGTNSKMSEYHAAVGLAQMARWPQVKKRRTDILQRLKTAMNRTGLGFSFQPNLEQAVPSIIMLRTPDGQAARLIDGLQAAGIFAHQMYLPPLYRHPHFARTAIVNAEGVVLKDEADEISRSAHMPNSEWMAQNLLGLPFHPFLDQEDIDDMVKTLVTLASA